MFYYLSKIAWLGIQPVGLLTLCFASILLVSFLRSRKLLRLLAFLGLLFVLGAAQTNVGRLMLQPLENRFARPGEIPPPGRVAGIIVLGGGFDGYVTQRRGGFELGESGDRFVETLRLAKALPDVPVVISGGEASLIRTTEGDASIAVRFFTEFGIDENRLILENRSLNTHENAALTKTVIAGLPKGDWLLVTSAFHMPRSVGGVPRAGDRRYSVASGLPDIRHGRFCDRARRSDGGDVRGQPRHSRVDRTRGLRGDGANRGVLSRLKGGLFISCTTKVSHYGDNFAID